MKRRHFLQTSMAAAATVTIPFALFSKTALAQALEEMTEVNGDIDAVTGEGAEITIERAAVEDLKGALRGRLLLPGQDQPMTDGWQTKEELDNRNWEAAVKLYEQLGSEMLFLR